MKWLTRISAHPEPQTGFYMETAYRFPETPGEPGAPVSPEKTRSLTQIFVKSNITEAPASLKVGTRATIRGFAFSGAPDIARVEVSEDGGANWMEAALDPRHDPYAWRLWSLQWAPKSAGTVTLLARATDSQGSTQPQDAVWNPSGYLYNGWHSVRVEVTA